MKKVTALFLTFFTLATFASNALSANDINVDDKAVLQRGARFFMNYCSGCHSLKYMRYNRLARDLDLTTFSGEIDNELLLNNLVFTKATITDPIQISMPAADARQWFGRVPPDLSLTARERGANWIYAYLKSFYADSKRPFGANNLLVPDVAMPNVLAPLLGNVELMKEKNIPGGSDAMHLVLVTPGSMSEQQFDSALRDLVTFLVYVAEPAQLERFSLGYRVLFYLFLLLSVAYPLKRVYWRRLDK